jgi:eukaryotic-like serine/threonine-protein kinase
MKHIDHAVAQFRAAWDSGTRPQIEDFLADTDDAARAELLMRLLAEELACRIRIGETPAAEEYEQRLPADAETVRQAFNRATPFAAKPSEQNTHSHQQAVLEATETQAWEPPAAKPTSEPGRPEFIGRYKVVGVLGRGGFGTVYRARDEQLQRDVAIKVWRRDRFAGDEAVEHLLQEARHVARLDEHPSIVGVYDVGRQDDGSAFVVFQYIEGHSLAEELKSHPLPPDRVWEVMLQVTSAIQNAHATGLVHRDLKPANVLFDKDGNARVADFGLAVDDQSQRLHAGEVSGTPAYMSPEQVRGEAHRLDGRTDLWALGVMLYEMLVHRRPFQGQSRQEVFDEILHRDPKPPRQLDPQLPADLERICLKCLSKDATQRYLTAADLAKDLRHAHQAPQRRKRRMMTIASVVAAGLLILAAFWGYLTQQGEQPVISVQPGAGLVIRHRATLRGHSDAVWWVAFSPDDRLWDAETGVELAKLRGHQGSVTSVAFSSDGSILASASADKTVQMWELEEASPAKPAEPPKPAKVDRKPVKIPPAPPQEPPPAIAPFDADTARKHQEAWAEYLDVQVEFENSIGMKFVLIPPGEFDMGSTEEEVEKLLEEARATNQGVRYIDRLPGEAPRHRVPITKPFYLGMTEVTQAQYERVMGANPSNIKGDPTRPVEMVSWNDAVAFFEKLNDLSEEQAPRAVYRLPTEAEWEYACRAGTTTRWYATNDEAVLQDQAWFAANSGGIPHRVGQKLPNAWRLYDMHGNVCEWCADWHGPTYYENAPTDDPKGPADGSYRVYRGGGWWHDASFCRSACRGRGGPGRRGDDLGFRLARTVP